MRIKFSLLYFILILIVFGSFALKANATSVESILVSVLPSNPKPQDNVNISLNSYEDNLDNVLISWSVSGKTIISGIGKKSFSITAPLAGKETNIIATVSLPDGQIDKTIIIKPSVMTLLWQANDSYTPPFYKGKALPTPNSEVKVVAMPEIKSGSAVVSPQNLTYYWKKDYTNDVNGSGYGKNSFTYVNDYLDNSNNISVVASTTDQTSSTDASIDITTVQPKILFYKNDDVLGTIWQNALADSHKITGTETIEAAPYFISPKEIRNPMLVWSWFINDEPVDIPIYKPNFIPLQAQSGTSGTSKLRLEIENTASLFQATTKEINIEF